MVCQTDLALYGQQRDDSVPETPWRDSLLKVVHEKPSLWKIFWMRVFAHLSHNVSTISEDRLEILVPLGF